MMYLSKNRKFYVCVVYFIETSPQAGTCLHFHSTRSKSSMYYSGDTCVLTLLHVTCITCQLYIRACMAHYSLRSFRINIYIPNVLTALSNRTFMVTYKLEFSTQTNLKDYIL